MESHQQECLTYIQDFKSGASSIEWQAVYEHEQMQEVLNDAVTNLIYHVSLLKSLELKTKTELVGALVIHQAELASALTFQNEASFVTAGQALEATMRKIIGTGTWLAQATVSFDLLEKLQGPIENGTLSQEQTESLIPVLILLEMVAIIDCDQEGDDCCDEDEE